MRILGFHKKWDKLQQDTFTTFRFTRKDKDWAISECVQIIYKPRSKEREILGIAKIIDKEHRGFDRFPPEDCVARSEIEAQQDGFIDREDMVVWLDKIYGDRIYEEPMNKLTLRWVE